MQEIKQAFITKALIEYNQEVIAAIKTVAKRMGVGVTNEGINSLAYNVISQGNGAGSTLSFKEYLRMVDMGAGRAHPLGGLKKTYVQLQVSKGSGLKQSKDNIRKPKKFYSKVAYGKITGLTNHLLYGFSEEAIAAIKDELQNNPTT